MAFIKTSTGYKIGDLVKTTKIHSTFEGYFEVGTIVRIIGVSERGYNIQEDGEGTTKHIMYEVGWVI